MTDISTGLIVKIERATQSAQMQIKRSATVDNARERTNNLNLVVASSAGASQRSIKSAAKASEILNEVTIHNENLLSGSLIVPQITLSANPPIVSTYEISDASMTPIVAPTTMIKSLFDIREITISASMVTR